MAEEQAKIDQNYRHVLIAVTDDILQEIRNLIVDPVSKRLKVQATVSGDPVFGRVKINDAVDLPEWQSGFDYEIGDVIVGNNGISNNLYQATSNHTSGATFNGDIANWELISTGSGGSLTLVTTNFNRILSATDNNPQTAFETLDDEVAGINIENTFSEVQKFDLGIEDNDTTNPIKIAEAGDGEFNTTKKSITGAVNELKGRLDTIVNPLLYKGVINLPADFPTLALVQTGWYYHISTDVTDNDVTKTNTGLSFIVGDDIAWNGSTWEKLGTTSLWVRSGNTLQPANPNDNVNIGSGAFTGADVNITNLNAGMGIISSGAVKLSIQELDQVIYDRHSTGFISWSGAGNYYSIQGSGASAFFRLLRGGTVRINGKLVTFAGNQDAPASGDNTLNYLYIDPSGVLQQTVNRTTAYANGAVIFELLDDGTNHVVVKENHPYDFDSQVSKFLHGTTGTLIGDPTTGANLERVATGTGASAGDRELRIQGASNLIDHGLYTVISDTGVNPITINWYYKSASGKWERYLQQTQAPMVYNNAGVITALLTTANGDVGLATIYVSKDDLNSSNPTYYGVIHTASVNTPAQAQAIIDAGTNAQADNELDGLELAQLGTIVLQNNVSGGYIERRNISKKTITTGTTVGSGSSVASGINLDTTNFDKVLSGSDTNVQVAMETLDELGNQLTTNNLRARTSAGIQMLNNSGSVIAIFGAGGGLGVGFNNGITVANSGAFNTSQGDYDFTINGIGKIALTYDAGLDQFNLFSYINSTQDINIATGKSYKINGVALKDVTETLTNKTLTSPVIQTESSSLTTNIANAGGANILWQRARGTLASPTQVLSGDVIYNLLGRALDNGGTPAYQNVAGIQMGTLENITSTTAGGYLSLTTSKIGETILRERLKLYSDKILLPNASLIGDINAPQGFLINGKIVRTVDGSGNMTVAIKTLANADPSATDPVYVRIGNTVRAITYAVSETLFAGNSTMNLGSAELATKEVDLAVYLGFRASDSKVYIGASRIFHGRTIADFSGDIDNEKFIGLKYLGFLADTDEVELVGRINAIQSAGSAYTWSIPATDIIINRWENSSEFHTWNLTLSGGTTTPTFCINNNRYKIVGNRCIGTIVLNNNAGGTAGSGSGDLVLKLPFSAKSSNYLNDGIGYYLNNAVSIPVALTCRTDIGTDCFVLNNMGRNTILSSAFNSEDRGIYINFDYEI